MSRARGFELFEARDGTGPLDQLLRETQGPLLTFEQEKALARRMRGQDVRVPPPGAARPTPEEAQHRLVTANVRLAVTVARRYAGLGVALEDLVQEGVEGLHRAAEKYDPERGFRFSTYVMWWIRQSVGRAVQAQARTVRIPVNVGARARRLVEAEGLLSQRHATTPTHGEVAASAGIARSEAEIVRRAAVPPISLDLEVWTEDEPGGETLAGLWAVADDDVEADSVEDDAASRLRYALTWLQPRERVVLALRFGIGQDHAYSLQETGQVVGVTRERARQLEQEAKAAALADPMAGSMLAALAG